MASKKIEYILYTPGCAQGQNPLVYTYDKVKYIELTVQKTGFCVKMLRTINREPNVVLEDRTFKDAVKKASLIQLIKFGQCSEITELYLSIDGRVFTVYDAESVENLPLIYSLCGYKLKRPLTGPWDGREQLQIIVETPKSHYDRKFAALFALLVSHAKEYETERFLYLWMSMNGLYGYLTGIANQYALECGHERWIKREYQELKMMASVLNYPYRGLGSQQDKEKNKLLKSLMLICDKIPNVQIAEFARACQCSDNSNTYVEQILNAADIAGLKGTMHPYMLLLLWLPYQIRCKFFHGEDSVPLLCFQDEYPLPLLKVVNYFLEDNLNNILPKVFSVTEQAKIVNEIKRLSSESGFNYQNLK